MSNDIPLIWTSRGNLPVASLQHVTSWEQTAEYTKLTDTYSLDGEVVKQSVHVLQHQGLGFGAETAQL